MINVSINSDISEISLMIDKLKNYSDKLDAIKENPISPEAKTIKLFEFYFGLRPKLVSLVIRSFTFGDSFASFGQHQK